MGVITKTRVFTPSFWRIYFKSYDVLNKLVPYQRLIGEVCQALEVKKTDKVLDAGCGTGNVTLQIKKLGAEIIGLDNSPVALKLAAVKKENQGIEFRLADLNQPLPFADGTFDKISANHIIYSLPQPQKTLAEFYRILKSGGRLVMTNPTTSPNPVKVFRSHLKLKFLELNQAYSQTAALSCLTLETIKILPKLIKVGMLNTLIATLGEKEGFHFFTETDLRKMAQSIGFKILTTHLCYGDTDLLTIWGK